MLLFTSYTFLCISFPSGCCEMCYWVFNTSKFSAVSNQYDIWFSLTIMINMPHCGIKWQYNTDLNVKHATYCSDHVLVTPDLTIVDSKHIPAVCSVVHFQIVLYFRCKEVRKLHKELCQLVPQHIHSKLLRYVKLHYVLHTDHCYFHGQSQCMFWRLHQGRSSLTSGHSSLTVIVSCTVLLNVHLPGRTTSDVDILDS